MNKVIISGRVVRDADVRYSQTANGSMAVARYTLAVDRTFKKEGEQAADFINCIAFGKNGEFAEKYLHQGTRLSLRADGRQATIPTKTDRKSTPMIALLKDTNFAKAVPISRAITVTELWAVMLVRTALCRFQIT